jgi:hypothetical protein
MNPKDERRPLVKGGVQDEQQQLDSNPQPSRPTTAAAVAYAPAGSRQHWALVVPACPYCHGAHLHRGAAYGGIRRAGCGRGEYLVRALPTSIRRVVA